MNPTTGNSTPSTEVSGDELPSYEEYEEITQPMGQELPPPSSPPPSYDEVLLQLTEEGRIPPDWVPLGEPTTAQSGGEAAGSGAGARTQAMVMFPGFHLPILVKLHPGSEKGLPDDDAIRGMLTRNHCFTYPGYEWAQTLFYVCRLGKEGVFTGEEAENLVKTGRPYHTTR